MSGRADDVPPHRDVVDDRHQVAAEDVQHRDDHEHGEERVEHPGQRVVVRVGVRVRADREVDEGRAAVGDTGGDGDQADQVQPAGEEAGLRAAELRGPPVDAARGRVGRHQLGHGEPDEQDERTEDRPGPRDRDRAAVVEAGAEVREAAGQDRDDRERDREVGETGPGPVEVLLVAQLGEASSRRRPSSSCQPPLQPPAEEVRPRHGHCGTVHTLWNLSRVYTSAEVSRSRTRCAARRRFGGPPGRPGRYCTRRQRSRPNNRKARTRPLGSLVSGSPLVDAGGTRCHRPSPH